MCVYVCVGVCACVYTCFVLTITCVCFVFTVLSMYAVCMLFGVCFTFFCPFVPLDSFSIYFYVQIFPEYDLQPFLTLYIVISGGQYLNYWVAGMTIPVGKCV